MDFPFRKLRGSVALEAIVKRCCEISSKVCNHLVDPFLGGFFLGSLFLAEVEVVTGIPWSLQTFEIVQLSCDVLHVTANVLHFQKEYRTPEPGVSADFRNNWRL